MTRTVIAAIVVGISLQAHASGKGWADYYTSAWTNYASWSEFFTDYSLLRRDIIRATDERSRAIGYEPLASIVESWKYTKGWQTNVVSGITNVYIAQDTVITTNVTTTFTNVNGVVVNPWITRTWWAEVQLVIENLMEYDVDPQHAWAGTNGWNATAGYEVWYSVTNSDGEYDTLPIRTLASMFSDLGIGVVTNATYWDVHTNVIKDGAAAWTYMPARSTYFWLGEAVGTSSWVFADGDALLYGYGVPGVKTTNVFPMVSYYTTSGTSEKQTVTVYGTSMTGSGFSETVEVGHGTSVTLSGMVKDVTNIVSATAPKQTGDVLRVYYTNSLPMFVVADVSASQMAYHQEGVVLDEIVMAIKGMNRVTLPFMSWVSAYYTNGVKSTPEGTSCEDSRDSLEGYLTHTTNDALSAEANIGQFIGNYFTLGTTWYFYLDDHQSYLGILDHVNDLVNQGQRTPVLYYPSQWTNFASVSAVYPTTESYAHSTHTYASSDPVQEVWLPQVMAMTNVFPKLYERGSTWVTNNYLAQTCLDNGLTMPQCSTNAYPGDDKLYTEFFIGERYGMAIVSEMFQYK